VEIVFVYIVLIKCILRDALRPAESTASTRQDGFISENLRLRIVVMRRRALFNTKKTTIGAITTH